jgi:alpha-1,6-mannosyltransferase
MLFLNPIRIAEFKIVNPLQTSKILVLGLFSLLPYLAAWWLSDLREHTVGFEIAFFTAFALYAGVVMVALRQETFSKPELIAAFVVAMVMQGCLIFTPPTLSNDMYRYVWDGRVQAHGLSPYRYPPRAWPLVRLRDETIWPEINRKASVTVYPPATEMTFAWLWRIWPDSVRWFQIVMAAGGLVAGMLLVGLLQALGRSPTRVLIYLWSPLLAFETAHAAHVDGLILPLLVGAWWARAKERDTLVGILLGLAAAMKFYPALLLPALWRPNHLQGRWRLPLAFAVTVMATYLPYLFAYGDEVIGFLPKYLQEQFNIGPLVNLLLAIFNRAGLDPQQSIGLVLLALLGLVSVAMMLRPAADGATAIRRSLWLLGAYTLLSYNLFSWYLLWLLPLLALFLRPDARFGLRLDAWTGWWLFSGSIALSYTFFIAWKPVPVAQWAEFLPLYVFLLFDLVRLGQVFSREWLEFRQKGQEFSRNYSAHPNPSNLTTDR